jgi:hypothetical protein
MTIHFSNNNSSTLFTRSCRCTAILALIATGLYSTKAGAQSEPSSTDTAAARELAIEGLKLADAGHCAQAIDKLFRAEKLRHSPIVLGRLGECQIEEGKFVDGTEDLQRLLHEPVAPNPPQSLVKARERAQSVLDTAKPKIAMLLITVRGASENVAVTVDGQPVPTLLLDRDRPTDPGEHVIEASAPGFFKATRRVSLGPGEKQEITLKLKPDPDAVIAAPPAASTPESSNPPTTSTPQKSTLSPTKTSLSSPEVNSTPNHTASTIFWIAGGAVAAAGGVFGYLALNGKHSLDNECLNNACPATSRDKLDAANLNATLSTVLVGAGAASLVLGTVFFFTEGSGTSERPAAGLHTRGFVGLNRVGLEGTF